MPFDIPVTETSRMADGQQPAAWPEQRIAWIIRPCTAGRGNALEASRAARGHFYSNPGWTAARSYIDLKKLDAFRPDAEKDHEAAAIDGNNAVSCHPSPDLRCTPATLRGGAAQMVHARCTHDTPLMTPRPAALRRTR
ncbi:hypothetical protein AB838_11000 [Rhodobacteraceae bacterium (ex Bugula neritina AB1)]|nr:hypothetical protein AB838_11000 [Rhodobacteraceae bacterium (ex Bugula neritina AB1)]